MERWTGTGIQRMDLLVLTGFWKDWESLPTGLIQLLLRKDIWKWRRFDLKKLAIPDTTSRKLNPTVLENIMGGKENPGNPKVVIDFKNLNPFMLDNVDSDSSVIFCYPRLALLCMLQTLAQPYSSRRCGLPEQDDFFWIVKAMLLAT